MVKGVTGTGRRPSGVAVAGFVLAAALIAAIMALQRHHQPHREALPGGNNGALSVRRSASATPRPTGTTESGPLAAAEKVAARYLSIAHARSYRGTDPAGWIAREKPDVTGAYYARLRARAPAGKTSAADDRYLQQLHANQVQVNVEVLSMGVAGGGEQSATRILLYVYYRTITRTATDPDGVLGPSIPVRLAMVHRSGTWLVNAVDGA